MNYFNAPEIKQLENVLDYCGNGGDCDKCDFSWMEDHGVACYRVFAKYSITYINGLKEVIDTYDKKIDELMEGLKDEN